MDDDARRGRLLVGEVHDNYAAALGGVAGHAGLFGTAPAVGAFARAMLRAARGDATVPAPFTPALVSEFTSTKTSVPGSSRALGLGYDAADFVVRHADVRDAHSATSASPARRSGSIPSAIAISCC